MSTITLGSSVHRLEVRLTRDADFMSTLTNATEPWGTASVELRFGNGEVWTATIAGSDAVFDVDQVDVNTMIDSREKRVRLYVIDGTNDECWAVGKVENV